MTQTPTTLELLKALQQSEQEIRALCSMVNSYAVQLGIMTKGKMKVRPEDWGEKARAAIANSGNYSLEKAANIYLHGTTDFRAACVHEEDMTPEQKALTVFREEIQDNE